MRRKLLKEYFLAVIGESMFSGVPMTQMAREDFAYVAEEIAKISIEHMTSKAKNFAVTTLESIFGGGIGAVGDVWSNIQSTYSRGMKANATKARKRG